MDVSDVQRILVVKLSSLGDLFHALPAVHGLKSGLGAEIDWVVQEEYAELVGCFRDVSDVIPFRRRGAVRGLAQFVRRLRARRYDLVVDLQGLLKSAAIARAARSARVIGPSFHREGSALLYSSVAGRRDKARHAVEENLDILRYLGLPVAPAEFPVCFPAVPLAGAAPRVGLAPVSRWPTKNWPAQRFAEVARRLRRDAGASVYVFGGGADREVGRGLREQAGEGVTDLTGTLRLPQAGGALASLDLLVTNDSGLMHMAAAVGTRVLAVFGATDPRRTGPYGAGHRVLQGAAPCVPCLRRTCAAASLQCLEQVSVDAVASAALEMVRR